MDEFQQFDNVGGFFIGNEAITTANGSVTAPYIKAATRDLKAHRDEKGYRKIPIGYSAADIATLRPMLQNYLACGSNASEHIDFFSLNAYSWCGQSTYQQSGYDQLKANSQDLHIPIFMSETGCNTVRPRDFADQNALYGEMADVWSGSIIYEWIEEQNNYGLISYGPKVALTEAPDGFPRSGTSYHILFLLLATQTNSSTQERPSPSTPTSPTSARSGRRSTRRASKPRHTRPLPLPSLAQTTQLASGRSTLRLRFLPWVRSTISAARLRLLASVRRPLGLGGARVAELRLRQVPLVLSRLLLHPPPVRRTTLAATLRVQGLCLRVSWRCLRGCNRPIFSISLSIYRQLFPSYFHFMCMILACSTKACIGRREKEEEEEEEEVMGDRAASVH
jgi:hypothetical protein